MVATRRFTPGVGEQLREEGLHVINDDDEGFKMTVNSFVSWKNIKADNFIC